MWRRLLPVIVLLGCPPPAQYAIDRPGLPCERATRVAHRTMLTLGYTVTGLVEPSVERAGAVTGTKTDAAGKVHEGRVVIRCTPAGATLQPVEEGFVPDSYEFSRAFDYSFTTLVQRPDVEAPWKSAGLEVLVEALDPYRARLDLGDVPTTGGAVPVRVTVRNQTKRQVRLDVDRLRLLDAGHEGHAALAGDALRAALAGNAAGTKLDHELFSERPIPGGETRTGFLVYPPGTYREAQVSIEDVETEETEGFVTPVQ